MTEVQAVQKVKVRYLVLKEMELELVVDTKQYVQDQIAEEVSKKTSVDSSNLQSYLWTATNEDNNNVVDLSDVKMRDLIKHFDV
jgi:hypothetical protein